MTNLERVLGALSAKDIAINIDNFHCNNDCLYAGRVECRGCPIEEVCGSRSINIDGIIGWLESEVDT